MLARKSCIFYQDDLHTKLQDARFSGSNVASSSQNREFTIILFAGINPVVFQREILALRNFPIYFSTRKFIYHIAELLQALSQYKQHKFPCKFISFLCKYFHCILCCIQ
jgi:hypothetical protein